MDVEADGVAGVPFRVKVYEVAPEAAVQLTEACDDDAEIKVTDPGCPGEGTEERVVEED